MRVGEKRAPRGEAVDVGRLNLRMTAHATDPIVLVVDGNEQNIRAFARDQRRPKCKREEYQTSKQHTGVPLLWSLKHYSRRLKIYQLIIESTLFEKRQPTDAGANKKTLRFRANF
jgi:hypothetical protein